MEGNSENSVCSATASADALLGARVPHMHEPHIGSPIPRKCRRIDEGSSAHTSKNPCDSSGHCSQKDNEVAHASQNCFGSNTCQSQKRNKVATVPHGSPDKIAVVEKRLQMLEKAVGEHKIGESLKQIRLQLCDVDFELKEAASVTDIHRLNAEVHDLMESIREIQRFLEMPPWLTGLQGDLKNNSSKISGLEQSIEQIVAVEKKLKADISICQHQASNQCQKYTDIAKSIIREVTDILDKLECRLAHVESSLEHEVLRIGQLEHSDQATSSVVAKLDSKMSSMNSFSLCNDIVAKVNHLEKDCAAFADQLGRIDMRFTTIATDVSQSKDMTRVIQLEKFVKDAMCSEKCMKGDLSRVRDLQHKLEPMGERLAALEAAIYDGVRNQVQQLADASRGAHESQNNLEDKVTEFSASLQTLTERVVMAERALHDQATKPQLCQLEESVLSCQVQLGKLQRQTELSTSQVSTLECSLKESQYQVQELQQASQVQVSVPQVCELEHAIAECQSNLLWLQQAVDAEGITHKVGALEQSSAEAHTKLEELEKALQATPQVNKLENLIKHCLAQLGELQHELHVKASAAQLSEFESMLAECQNHLRELQQESLGKGHLQQLRNFAMSIQVQVSDLEKELRGKGQTLHKLDSNLSTMGCGVMKAIDRLCALEESSDEIGGLLRAFQQELQEKAGISDLRALGSALTQHTANCDHAIEDKAKTLQELSGSISTLQERTSKYASASAGTVSRIQDLTKQMAQLNCGIDQAKAELQRLHQVENDIVVRIGKLESSKGASIPYQKSHNGTEPYQSQHLEDPTQLSSALSHAAASAPKMPAKTYDTTEAQSPRSPELPSPRSGSVEPVSPPLSWMRHNAKTMHS